VLDVLTFALLNQQFIHQGLNHPSEARVKALSLTNFERVAMSLNSSFPMPRLTVLAGLWLLTLGAAEVSADCNFTRTIETQLAVGSASSLVINALAGQLQVTGKQTDEIRVVGKVCVAEEEHLDLVRIDLQAEDGSISLSAVIPNGRNGPYGSGSIDLRVTVPEGLLTRISDTSGDMVVDNASVEHIQDSSGDIEVSDIRSSLAIEDSSGDIDIRGMSGKLTLGDSSGDIDVVDLQGDLLIKHDSSGDIDISRVTGDVEIEQDSSGNIDIADVDGQVIIGIDSAGDIDINKVGKSVTIGNDGSGTVKVSDVKGDLSLANKGEGRTVARNISGKTKGF
jgi:hypothetical protein